MDSVWSDCMQSRQKYLAISDCCMPKENPTGNSITASTLQNQPPPTGHFFCPSWITAFSATAQLSSDQLFSLWLLQTVVCYSFTQFSLWWFSSVWWIFMFACHLESRIHVLKLRSFYLGNWKWVRASRSKYLGCPRGNQDLLQFHHPWRAWRTFFRNSQKGVFGTFSALSKRLAR